MKYFQNKDYIEYYSAIESNEIMQFETKAELTKYIKEKNEQQKTILLTF